MQHHPHRTDDPARRPPVHQILTSARSSIPRSSIPLVEVVDSFDIFHTGQGSQGHLNRASKQELENIFSTTNEDEIVQIVLEKGRIVSSNTPHQYSGKNDQRCVLTRGFTLPNDLAALLGTGEEAFTGTNADPSVLAAVRATTRYRREATPVVTADDERLDTRPAGRKG